MKKILLMVVAVAMFACTPKQSSYVIEGTVTGEGLTDGKAYLTELIRVDPVRDTVDIVDGKFVFTGRVTTPEFYGITVEGVKGRITLFLENSEIKVVAETENFEKAEVTGAPTDALIKQHNAAKEEVAAKYRLNELQAEYYNSNTTDERRKEIIEETNEGYATVNRLDSAFFADNPYSFYTITQLIRSVENYPIEDMEAKVAAFKAMPEFEGNRYLKNLEEAVSVIKTVQPGMQAPDFTMNDPEGNPVALSDFYPENKLTMIDFWAGWCGPCRQFNPTLLAIYNKYKEHGFGIFGVSFDDKEELWHEAIEEDKLPWVQVSDLKGWGSAAGKLYYVRSIPANIFLDQEGKVIQRKVNRNEMEQFIKEYLGL